MIDADKTFKVWRNNRIDQEEDLPLRGLVERFLASEWTDAEMPVERAVRAYLADVEKVSYDPEDETIWDLIDLIRDRKFGK